MDASYIYSNRKFGELGEMCKQAGRVPTLMDYYLLLKSQKPRPRSSEEGYLERTLARVEGLIQMSGGIFAARKGMPVVEMCEKGRLVILDMRELERMVADFLSAYFLYYLYYNRLHSENPFGHGIVCVVLDEQRSLIRKRIAESNLPDIELLFSRARALNISLGICEQVPSSVGNAVLSSTRLRLAFNSNPPELVQVAQLLGLNREQARELQRLPIGHCVGRLSGSRIPEPFRLEIPAPSEEEADRETIRRAIQRSVSEMERHVIAVARVDEEKPPSGPPIPPKGKEKPKKGNRLEGNVLERFMRIVTKPPEMFEDAEKALGWDRGREQRARSVLNYMGVISYTTIGNKRKITFLSEQGKELAKSMGWEIRKHKGGAAHEWMLEKTEARFRRLEKEVEEVKSVRFRHRGFGDLFEGRQPDSLVLISKRNEKGEGSEIREERVAIQVCSRNNPDFEATSLGEELAWCDLRAVVLVAVNRDKKEAIRKKIMEISGGDIPEKIVLFHLEEILSPKINLGKELGLWCYEQKNKRDKEKPRA